MKSDTPFLNDVVESLFIQHPDSGFLKNMEGFLAQQQLYHAAMKEVRTKLEILDEEFKVHSGHNPIHHIEYRLKTPESILEKLSRKQFEVSLSSIRNNLTDVAGVRVVCYYTEDIFRIAQLLINQNDLMLLVKRDYINHPKPNGYRSLHLIVKVPVFLSKTTESVPVEIQLRTVSMDFWATLEHKLKYKSGNNVPEALHHRLKKCADVIAGLDEEMLDIFKEATNNIL